MPYCDAGTLRVDFKTQQDKDNFNAILSREDVDGPEEALRIFGREFTPDAYEEVHDMLPGMIEGFSPRTQEQMRESIRYLAYEAFDSLIKRQENDPDKDRVEITPEAWKNQTYKRFRENASKYNKSDDEFDQFVAGEYLKAAKNFDQFWDLVQNDFNRLGLETEDGAYRVKRSGDYDRKAWEDMARFFTSNQQTASTEVKMVMAHIKNVGFQTDEDGIPIKDENGRRKLEEKRNYIDHESYIPLDKAWNVTGQALADHFPRSFESMMERLKKVGEYNPVARRVHERFTEKNKAEGQEGLPDSVKRSFVNAMGKHYANFKYTLIQPDGEGGHDPYVGDSDRIQQGEAVLENWKDTMIQSEVAYFDDKEAVRVDEAKVEEIYDEYIDLLSRYEGNYRDEGFIRGVHKVMRRMGLPVPHAYLQAMADGKAEPGWAFNFAADFEMNPHSNSVMGSVFRALRQKQDEDGDPLLDQVHPLRHAERQSNAKRRLRNLAHQSVPYQTDVWAPSATFVTGDRYFALQDHERITRQIQLLKDEGRARQKLRDPFNQDSVLLRSILGREGIGDPQETREALEVRYIDGLNVQGRNAKDRIDDLSPQDQELMSVALFQNNGSRERLLNALTLSDRSRSFVLRSPNLASYYTGNKSTDQWEPTIEVGTDGETISSSVSLGAKEESALLDAALSEMNRIRAVQQKNDELGGPENHPFGEDYAKNATNFFLFPLNPTQIEEQFGEEVRKKIWERQADGSHRFKHPDDYGKETEDAIVEVLNQWMESKVESTIGEWSEGRIWNAMNGNYLSNQTPTGTPLQKKAFAAFDYVFSQTLGHVEMMRLFHGDPAQFVKPQDTFEETRKATLGEMQKRLAKEMGPALSHGFGENDTYNFVTLQDNYTTVNQISEYREMLENSDAYDGGIESTDAQEYTTLDEHIRVAVNHGRIDKEAADNILERIQKERQKGNYDWSLTSEEMKALDLTPHKPFYAGERWDSKAEMSSQMMVKTSSFPLVPNLVAGTPLDELRKGMEQAGVDRAAYGSGVKVGAKNPVDVESENGWKGASDLADQFQGNKDEGIEPSMHSLRRSGFGLQFVIPSGKDEISVSTQANQLLAAGNQSPVFTLPDGEEITQAQYYKRKRLINRSIMAMEAKSIADEVGAVLESEEEGRIDNAPNGEDIKNLVLDEAAKRDWSAAQIQEIEDIASSEFEKPLSLTGAGTKIENLLMSIVTNRITRRKTHGKAFVQASSSGMTWTNPQDANIGFAPGYDPTTKPSHVEIQRGEDGEVTEVKSAEIIVPWFFKDEDGNLLDMEDYMTTGEDGVKRIDTEKIEEELLEGMSFRIPNQGPSSNVPVRIAGFMPPSFKKLAFVPDGIVPQMGSDFDVDKLNTMLRQYKVAEDGSIQRIEMRNTEAKRSRPSDNANIEGLDYDSALRDQLDEEYLDLQIALSKSPEHIENILQPLDRDDLKGEKEVLMPYFNREDYLFPDRQQTDFKLQLDGKSLIGISSVAARMNSLFQRHPQQVQETPIRVRDEEGGSPRVLNMLGATDEITSGYSEEALSAHDAITLYQNSAVDNAKEFDLGPLNVNTQTAEALFPLLMLSDQDGGGPQLEHATRMMRQPAIEEVMTRMQEKMSNLDSGSSFTALNDAITETIEEYVARYSGEDGETEPASNIQAVISSPEQLLEDIENPESGTDFLRRQIELLRAFDNLTQINQDINQATAAFNFGNRQGPGKSLIEAGRHRTSLVKLENSQLSDPYALGGEMEGKNPHSFVPTTEEGDYAKYTYLFSEELFGDLFRYDAAPFRGTVTQYENVTGESMREDQVFNMWKDFTASVYAFAGEKALEESPSDIRNRLLYTTADGETKNLSLARRLMKARDEGWATDHPFLSFIEPDIKQDESSDFGIYTEDNSVVEGESGQRQKYSASKPDELHFKAPKLDESEQLQVRRDLARLLSSPDAEKQQLARDLVLYHMFVQGKKRSPRTFDEYVPPQFYREEGITQVIEDMNLDSFMSSGQFTEQWLQNNPHLAPRLTGEMRENDVTSPAISTKIEFRNDDIPDDLMYEVGRGETKAVPYVSFFDESFGRFRLFERFGGGYKEVSVLGDATGAATDLTEYKPLEDGRVKSDVRITASTKSEAESLDPPVSREDNEWKFGMYSYHLDKEGQDAEDMLSNISEDQEVGNHFRTLAYLLSQMNLKAEVRSKSMANNVTGRQRGSEIQLNRSYEIPDGVEVSEKDFAASETLHESLHAATARYLTEHMSKDPADRPPEVKKLVRLKNDLQSRIRDQYEGFDDFMVKYQRAQQGEEVSFDTPHVSLFSSVASVDELISSFFTDKQFQEWANQQDATETQSYWDRVMEWIQSFVETFAEQIGIDVRRGSLLEQGLRISAMNLSRKKQVFGQTQTDLNQGTSTEGTMLRETNFTYRGSDFLIIETVQGSEVYRTDGTEITGNRKASVMNAFFSKRQEEADDTRTDGEKNRTQPGDETSVFRDQMQGENEEDSSTDFEDTDTPFQDNMSVKNAGELGETFSYELEGEAFDRTYVVTRYQTGNVNIKARDGEPVSDIEAAQVKGQLASDPDVQYEMDTSGPLSGLRNRTESLGMTVGQAMSDMTSGQRATFKSLRKHIETRPAEGGHYIDGVYAPNGEPSQLFEDILDRTGDQLRALKLYLNVKSEPIPERHRDKNGEALIEAVLHRDDLGFGRRERVGDAHLSATGTSASEDGAIGSVVDKLYSTRNRLFKVANQTESGVRRQAIQEQITKINQQIQGLEKQKSVAEIEAVGQEHVDYVKSVLARSNPSRAEVNFARLLIDSWDYEEYTKDYLKEHQRNENNTINNALREISHQMEELGSRIKSMENKITMEEVNKDPGQATLEEAEQLPENGWLMSQAGQFFDLSKWDNDIISRFDKRMKVAAQNKADWIQSMRNKLEEKLEGIEDKTRLLQRDEEGNVLTALSNPYNSEYYVKRQQVLKSFQNAIRSPLDTNAMRKVKANFINDITETDNVVDIRYLVEELNDDGKYESREEYIDHLKETYGKEVGERAAEEAYRLWNDYKTRRQETRIQFQNRYSKGREDVKEGESVGDYVTRKMQEWDRKNDPLTALDEIMSGKVKEPFNKGHEMLHFVGKPEYQDSWYYEELSQQERDGADALREFFATLMQELPQNETLGRQANFLPHVRKDYGEFFSSKGLAAASGEVLQNWKDEWQSDAAVGLMTDETKVDEFAGLTQNTDIPIRHMVSPVNPTSEESATDQIKDHLTNEERSQDIQKMADKFLAMVGNYKYMSKVRPTVEIMGRKIMEMTHDADQRLSGDNVQGEVIRDGLKHHVNSLMFQDARADETNNNTFLKDGSINPVKVYNGWRERREIKEKHRQLQKKRERDEISRSEYEEKVEELDERMRELNGRRLSWGRLIESTLGRYTMIKGLGWSPVSAANNMIFGWVSNSMEASSGQYFNDRDLRAGLQEFLSMKREGSPKLGNLMQKFNIYFEIAEISYGKKSDKEKKNFVRRMVQNPMMAMNKTETFVQGLTMLAYMKGNTTTVEVNGETKEVPLWDVFDENGQWKEEDFGSNPEFQDNTSETEINDHASAITQVIKRVHGNFHNSSPMSGKEISWKRMLMTFRTWMFEGFSYRFGKEQKDSALGGYVKGTYVSAKDMWLNKDVGLSELRQIWSANDPEAKAKELGVDPTDAFNVRRVMREVRWWMRTAMATIVMASMFAAEDDDEKQRALTLAYNFAWRVNQDTTFYLNPGTPVELLDEPMPAMRTLKDAQRTISMTVDALNPGTTVSKSVRDQWLQSLPAINNIYSAKWMTENRMDQIQ